MESLVLPARMQLKGTYYLTEEFVDEEGNSLLDHEVLLKKYVSAKIHFKGMRGSAAIMVDKAGNTFVVAPNVSLRTHKSTDVQNPQPEVRKAFYAKFRT